MRSAPGRRWLIAGRWALTALLVVSVGLLFGALAWAVQHTVRARVETYDDAPVRTKHAVVRLVQTFSNPSQFPFASIQGEEIKIARTRVRYMNRKNQQAPTYELEGEVEVRNGIRKPAAFIQLTAISLNAFQDRIDLDQQSISEPLSPGQTRLIKWSKSLPNEQVYEVVFVVTAVRFTDGTVWAPTEELVLSP